MKNTPVTEAHYALRREVIFSAPDEGAQLIADSEAKATVEIAMVAAASADRNVSLRLERDQLRAVFPQICEALGNGSCCAPDISLDFLQSIPNEVAGVVANLRAEVDAQCLLNAKGSEREAVLLGRVHRMAKECLNLRADLDAIKAIRDEEKARAESAEHRAERAEAELHALRLVCGTTDANKFSTWVDRAIARAEKAEAELAGIRALADRRNKRDHSQDTTHQLVVALDQALDIAQAELATERARLDWLMAGGVCMVQHAGGFHVSRLHAPVSRAHIDAAMKEEAK